MRICLYTETALPKLGGQELVVDALARQFLALGHEPVVVAPYPKRLPVDDGKLPYRVVRHLRFYSNRYLVRWYKHWLINFQRQYDWDIWHCHSVYPCGYLAALAAARCRVPFVITSHGGDIRAGNVRLRKPGLEARFRQSLAAANALIAISRFTEDAYRRLFPSANQIVSIPNGVEIDDLATPVVRPLGLADAIRPDRYALFLGRLHERKGVDRLIDAVGRLASSSDIELVIAGDGPEQAELARQVQRLQLENRVRFVGAVTGATKSWLLQNARLVAVPSRTWESFGLVVLEAYAAGKPVIASRLPGLEDLIEPGRTGLTVPVESPQELATAIGRLWNDRALAESMGQEALRKSREFTWQKIASQHIALYQRLTADYLLSPAA